MYFKGLNIFFSDCLALCLTQFIKLGLEGGELLLQLVVLRVGRDVGRVVGWVGVLEHKAHLVTFLVAVITFRHSRTERFHPFDYPLLLFLQIFHI